ncbi:acyl-CoA thioesterase (plasmid) [Sphingomonas paeninsulae]|jgi:acyl-CoA thioesterase-2|uniref:Acyl-CoA thioesterase n=1 Tax=Sphingomonas paeninsulae TaxID=2319844 RepID=A0A494TCS1_SPHPE|nr:acyl-CoA thioesterase domain-containing protein [Sphingomonas paeninsulae]AYJ85102.1 acyl-CoA thioesterase [Sphingomonas paeninsulae]
MKQFFDLRATHNPHRWYLPVTVDICVGLPERRFLFGGVGLAAAISALEQTCGRPVIWATAHYLSFAKPGSVVDLDVWVPVEGNQTSQANVIEHVDDRKIIAVSAALGSRDSPISDQWIAMPDVPGPDDCPEVRSWRDHGGDVRDRFEIRLASGRYPTGEPPVGRGDTGHVRFWLRSRDGLPVDSLMLAIAADYVSVAIGNAIGEESGGNSLDNTIRYARIVPCEWMLCDARIESVHSGIVHGGMYLFSEDGVLMATASQSLILRTDMRGR